MSGLAAWWRSLGRGQRAVVAVLGAVVGVNLLLGSFGSIFGSGHPGGPVSSSFSTGGAGLEGYADLLRKAGHPVVRWREGVAKAPLDPSATVVVADPGKLSRADRQALAAFVRSGGRLVVAGPSGAGLLGEVTGTEVGTDRGDPSDELQGWLPVDGLQGTERYTGDEGSRWTDAGPLLPAAGDGDDGRPWILVGDVGAGSVVALADAAPLHNAHLAEADNARLGLVAAGGPERPVVFLESVHGYGATGLSALPAAWRWSGGGLVLALAVGMWAAGARFGPPEPSRRALRPPRADHVEAVAADLQAVTPAPTDLAGALHEGAAAAEAARRRFGVEAATVPQHPHEPGGPS